MRIVNVIPIMESKEMQTCEMWMSKGPTHDPVPILGYPEEVQILQKACWHATECGWVAFIAQMAQVSAAREPQAQSAQPLAAGRVGREGPYQANVLGSRILVQLQHSRSQHQHIIFVYCRPGAQN